MKKKLFVLDSYAIIGYFLDEHFRPEIAELLVEAQNSLCEIYMSSVNAGEVYYMMHRKMGHAAAVKAWEYLRKFHITIFEPDIRMTLEAAQIKAGAKLSYADAFAAALTVYLGAVLITGDREFKGLKDLKGFKLKMLG